MADNPAVNPTPVATNHADVAGNTLVLTTTRDILAGSGSTLLLGIGATADASAVTVKVAGVGNVWRQDGFQFAAGANQTFLWSAPINIAVPAGTNITITTSANVGRIEAILMEATGLQISAGYTDLVFPASGIDAAPAISSGATKTSMSNELVVGIFASTATTFTAGVGYTAPAAVASAAATGFNKQIVFESVVSSIAAAKTVGLTYPSSLSWAGLMVTYKGTSVVNMRYIMKNDVWIALPEKQLFQNGMWGGTGKSLSLGVIANKTSVYNTAITNFTAVGTTTDSSQLPLAYTMSGAPVGINIDAATGVVSGTPTTQSANQTTITVTDASGTTASRSFTWTVTSIPSNTITLATVSNKTSNNGTAITTFSLSATDSSPSATITYSLSNAPAGISVDPNTGNVSGIPTTQPQGSVTATATDNTGASASQAFTWTVSGGRTSRFLGDPGIGYMLYGANNSSGSHQTIAEDDVQVFGGTASNPNKIHNTVREYNFGSSFCINPSDYSNLKLWVNVEKRLPFYSFKSQKYNTSGDFSTGAARIAAVSRGTAPAADVTNINADIDGDAAWVVANLNGPIVFIYHHEPDEEYPTDQNQADYREAWRYIVARFARTPGTSSRIQWCSPMWISDRFTNSSKHNTWQRWNPNWTGKYDAANKPIWYNPPITQLDGIDAYNPHVSPTAGNTTQSWAVKITNAFIQQRIDSNAPKLPWVIGEWGIYTLPAGMDAHVTLSALMDDMLSVGVKTQNLVAVMLWGNGQAPLDDANDPGRVKRNAWRDHIARLPVSGVTIP